MPRQNAPYGPAQTLRFVTLRHPWGTAALAASPAGLCAIVLLGGRRALAERLAALGHPMALSAPEDGPLLGPARDWLETLLVFGQCDPPPVLTSHLPGTSFQVKVWRAIAAIPSGQTRSYGEIAREIGRSRAARAVGAASAANPLPPLIPCHRLMGASGGLRGYAGGLKMKRRLLEIERSK